MWRVKHLMEVALLEYVILTYQHLKSMNKIFYWICYFQSNILWKWCYPFYWYLTYFFSWLFDLHQDWDNEEQQHHSCCHTDHCPMSLCDLVKNTFAFFFWMINMKRVTKRDKKLGTSRGIASTSVIYLLQLCIRTVFSVKAKRVIQSHSNQLRCHLNSQTARRTFQLENH